MGNSDNMFRDPDELRNDNNEISGDFVREDSLPDGIEVLLICEECNNRWDDVVFNDSDDNDELFCPMCGSKKVFEV